MTSLSKRKTRLTFETDNVVQRRTLIVEPEPLICVMRRKGTRQRLAINWESVYLAAAEIAAEKIRRERKQKRMARRARKDTR